MEEALHDVSLYCEFARLDTGGMRLPDETPDETTLLRFRHLLEANHLSSHLLVTINATLAAKGLMLKTGTVVDASLIAARISTKNSRGKRDPLMHQTKKGNQGHFGIKENIGVNADWGPAHSVMWTGANVNDVTQASAAMRGEGTDVELPAERTRAAIFSRKAEKSITSALNPIETRRVV